jgi:hypothetical protein
MTLVTKQNTGKATGKEASAGCRMYVLYIYSTIPKANEMYAYLN